MQYSTGCKRLYGQSRIHGVSRTADQGLCFWTLADVMLTAPQHGETANITVNEWRSLRKIYCHMYRPMRNDGKRRREAMREEAVNSTKHGPFSATTDNWAE